MATKYLSFANFKGGTGRTTSVHNVGAELVNRGNRILLVDLDPQHNLTQGTGITAPKKTLYDVLHGAPVEDAICNITEGMDIIPADVNLGQVGIQLGAKMNWHLRLTQALAPINRSYDFVLMDCPPSLSFLTINALAASQLILVPVEAEFYSLNGFTELRKQLVNEYGIQVDGIFITKYDKRKVLNREVRETIREIYPDIALQTVIRDNVALAEAPAMRQSIFEYSPRSYGAADYKKLTTEILNIWQGKS